MNIKRQRTLFIGVSILFLCAATLLALNAFKQNIVFFYSPSEIPADVEPYGKRFRIGGLVEKDSVFHDLEGVFFTVTDGKSSIKVQYQGTLPNLFREGQGVVAEGWLDDKRDFVADRVLAKHDENYMPPEVADSLKKSGRWYGNTSRTPAP